MGSGMITLIFFTVITAILIVASIFSIVGLIFKHCEDKEFSPKLFWCSIGFLILSTFSILGIVDFVKYDDLHEPIKQEIKNSEYEEIKTFDIYIKDGETYLNAKNAKIISGGHGYISFDTEDGRHLETNAETVVEVHTEIIKK